MRVESIFIHPVKATKAVPVTGAEVELSGLRHDRRWAIVDLDGKRLNATHHDTLLAVTAMPGDDGGLTLMAEGREPASVPVPVGGPLIPVNVSRMAEAVDAGDPAAEWFSQYLGKPVRLVWQADPTLRTMSAKHGGLDSEPLSLADTGPLLLTSTASLNQLNEWIGDGDLAMERFRPNVVVDGDEPFAEDRWRHIRIGDVPYRFAEHCDRCVVTTIDPHTLSRGKEPIRTLARHRKWDGKTWFGIRIVPLSEGSLSLGDGVEVIS
ncbi:MAG: MOSC domain-containing protein [Actinomycetota bacterium]|nr:MOSC domain-containing protein [Actinomycetota bacterium]